jgi:hypothetical protein
MEFDLYNIFKTEPMNGATINGWIPIPTEFVAALYMVIGIVIVVATSYFVRKGYAFIPALKKSMLVAFFCSGVSYLVYSENTWYGWFFHDLKTYWGHNSEEKTKIFGGPFYDLITMARNYLGDNDYTVYSTDDYTRLLSQYYLLPKRNRADAKYVLVLYDNYAYYDVNSKTFIHDDKKIENAELIFIYDPRAFILRIK